jgi:rhodanese-related sulfurtransferase
LLAALPDPHYHPEVRLALQTALLAAAGSLAGLGMNLASPRPVRLFEPVRPAAEVAGVCKLPGAAATLPRIPVGVASPMCTACTAAFVDARGAAEYAAGHVSGAVHAPPGPLAPELLRRLEAFRTVVVYDGDPASGLADAVAVGLRERGLVDVRVLDGSWPAWIAAGAPGESGPCAACATSGVAAPREFAP